MCGRTVWWYVCFLFVCVLSWPLFSMVRPTLNGARKVRFDFRFASMCLCLCAHITQNSRVPSLGKHNFCAIKANGAAADGEHATIPPMSLLAGSASTQTLGNPKLRLSVVVPTVTPEKKSWPSQCFVCRASETFLERVFRRKYSRGKSTPISRATTCPRKIRSKQSLRRTAGNVAKARAFSGLSQLTRHASGRWSVGYHRVWVDPGSVRRYIGGGVVCSLSAIAPAAFLAHKLSVETFGVLLFV